MGYLSQDKLVILGAAGAIGSNMMQSALTMGLTPNVCGYDRSGALPRGTDRKVILAVAIKISCCKGSAKLIAFLIGSG